MQDTAISTLLAALAQPVLLIGADGHVEAANPLAMDLFGAHVLGAPIRGYLRQPDVAALLDRLLAGDEWGSACYLQHCESRETVWRITGQRFGAEMLVLSLADISAIEAAEAQRRDFVANVSHELRSPLTVLSGFIETLQGPAGEDPATRAEFLGIMAEQAARMSGLVADLLSLSRVEAVERIRPRSPVSLPMVLRATLAALRPQIEAAQIAVDALIPDDLPDITGDHDQLVQVFHNLIENGIKYGGAGERLEIRAEARDTHPGLDGPVQSVSIRDFGEGIDPIYIPRLTERFYRLDKARARDSGGTGLGLSIVKHIVNRHRGRLIIRSARGEGAYFQVILPATPATKRDPEP